jgi:hypothetical protein
MITISLLTDTIKLQLTDYSITNSGNRYEKTLYFVAADISMHFDSSCSALGHPIMAA